MEAFLEKIYSKNTDESLESVDECRRVTDDCRQM